MLLFVVLAAVISSARHASGWDLAVSVHNQLELLDLRKNTSHKLPHTYENLRALAYDHQNRHIFLGGGAINGSNIFAYNFDSDETVTPIITEPHSQIQGIAYDSVNDALYWTSDDGGSLMWYRSASKENRGKVLHQFDNARLQGIAIDVCDRYLFWTNIYTKHASIERSSLDDFKPEVLIDKNVFMPMGIAVDRRNRKIFWCDDSEAIYFKIERSNYDGTNRELVHSSKTQEPFSITIGYGRVFWTEWAYAELWSLPVTANPSTRPRKEWSWGKGTELMGVVTLVDTSCSVDYSTEDLIHEEASSTTELTTPATAGTTLRSDADVFPDYCMNSGVLREPYQRNVVKVCSCPRGYTGHRCEINVCHNYCIHGQCQVDEKGNPNCTCLSEFEGERCERQVCDGYCVNGGICRWDRAEKKPRCDCPPSSNFGGERCEKNLGVEQLCTLLCQHEGITFVQLEDSQMPPCSCSSLGSYSIIENSSEPGSLEQCPSPEATNLWYIVAPLIFIIFLLVVSLFVALKRIRDRRPRIKKRFIMKKNAKQQELSSRPVSPPGSNDQCEITIENCCNMNICETPCYEPQLRPSKGTKPEEKKNLLASMDEAPGSSPSHESLY